MSEKSIQKYQSQYLTGASSPDGNTILAWFNGQAYHSTAISLNLVHNAIIKMNLGSEYGVQVTNEPFKFYKEPKDTSLYESLPPDLLFGFTFTIAIGIAMSIYSAYYVMFYVRVISLHFH